MQIGEAVRTSAAEILSHKLRSALTLVGIVLGTTALVVMVSVIGGLADGGRRRASTTSASTASCSRCRSAATDRIEQKKQGYSRGMRAADGARDRGRPRDDRARRRPSSASATRPCA